MIPVLFSSAETEFKSNGLGRLSSALGCLVTEERNGQYELEMVYPITGEHFKDIALNNIIFATPADGKSQQAFRIYKISKPIDGNVTIDARHISYQLSKIPTLPKGREARSAAAALNMLKAGAVEPCPFSFESDVTRAGTYSLSVPSSIRSQLGGVEGSVLIHLAANTSGITGRVGRSCRIVRATPGLCSGMARTSLISGRRSRLRIQSQGSLPFWKKDSDDGTQFVNLSTPVYAEGNAENYPFHMTEVIDFSQEFENAPTKEQLRSRAEQYIKSNGLGVPDVNISVSFLALWQGADRGLQRHRLS